MPGFGGYSIEQLMAMVAHFSPETVEARGTALVKAAGDIKAIGEILKSHKVSGWEGEASTAFQEWVSQAGSATLRLSEYSATGGKYMVEAGQTMREVRQDMPKRDEVDPELANYAAAKKFHNDPDMQPISRDSWRKLEAHRAGAVQQLEKLASSYTHSAYQMNTAEIPTFPPPPANFVPPTFHGNVGLERPEGARGAVAGPEGRFSASQSTSGPSTRELTGESGRVPRSDSAVPLPSSTNLDTANVVGFPDREVTVDLNTAGTLPDKVHPSPPIAGTLPDGPGARGNPVLPIAPVTLPPAIGLGNPGGPGLVGGGKLTGPSGPFGKVVGAAGLPARDPGIVGGRALPATGSSAGIPRGTVIGGEAGQAGRGMMGGGMGHGAGAPHGASGGSAVGRRLASETGGVAGGRRPGVGGQPFTQGGSGLVRNAPGTGPVGGAMGHGSSGSQNPGRRRDGQAGERPDYLAEDEETWQANRRVVPPVID
ncbi:WXG100 family type VII secretion target [Streptomyces sp. NPDC055005]